MFPSNLTNSKMPLKARCNGLLGIANTKNPPFEVIYFGLLKCGLVITFDCLSHTSQHTAVNAIMD
jgi:hypothetical protein